MSISDIFFVKCICENPMILGDKFIKNVKILILNKLLIIKINGISEKQSTVRI